MGPQHDSCGRIRRVRYVQGGRRLQWGRNMIVAEGVSALGRDKVARPLQWGRNMIVAEGKDCR